jgi:hypothetical protein
MKIVRRSTMASEKCIGGAKSATGIVSVPLGSFVEDSPCDTLEACSLIVRFLARVSGLNDREPDLLEGNGEAVRLIAERVADALEWEAAHAGGIRGQKRCGDRPGAIQSSTSA